MAANEEAREGGGGAAVGAGMRRVPWLTLPEVLAGASGVALGAACGPAAVLMAAADTAAEL